MGMEMLSCLGCATGERQDCRDRLRVLEPRIRFGAQPLASRERELVVPRATIVLRGTPLGAEPAAALHSLQGLIQRAVIDAECPAGAILEPRGDGVAVHRAPAKRLEDEKVERAFQQRQGIAGRHSMLPVSSNGSMWEIERLVKRTGTKRRRRVTSG